RRQPRCVRDCSSDVSSSDLQGPLARKLTEWSGLDRVFFANSGTEAIDGAMKLARLLGRRPEEPAGTAAKKHRFLALDNSFHGRRSEERRVGTICRVRRRGGW